MSSAAHISLGAISERRLLAGQRAPRHISAARVCAAAATARRVVVLDDDPTGTQSVAEIPIVTAWGEEDLRWAIRQDTHGFYVLTNTRSLDEERAAARNRDVLGAVRAVAEQEGIDVCIVSRGDSTLRGHFPLETDVLADELEAQGQAVDGVVLIPAYIDAGRVTVDSTHWVRTAEGFVPAGRTEFAADPEFGYTSSALHEYVAEKSAGRWSSEDVVRITLEQLRSRPVPAIAAELRRLRGRRPVVVDAAGAEDLRAFALAAIEAERDGATLLYRSGPSFVRDRLGQDAHPPLPDATLRTLLAVDDGARGAASARGGLVVAGSYVGLTTRQLEALSRLQGLRELSLDVADLLSSTRADGVIDELAGAVADGLAHGDIVLSTSRTRIGSHAQRSSREVQAAVSDGLVEIVARAVAVRRPRWIVAKGGITSSDLATRALSIRRAWARGTLLAGVVSLWEPESDGAPGIPYVVFAGNVGDEHSLADVVTRLRAAS